MFASPRIFESALLVWFFLSGYQQTAISPSPQTNAPVQQQPVKPITPPRGTEAQTSQTPKSVPLPTPPMTPREKAWQTLEQGCTAGNLGERTTATRVLGLIPRNPRALKLVERALKDDKPEVRTAAAVALGDMKSKTSIPKLKEALDDQDPSVALAAAHSLNLMHDDSAYEVY
jgi:HEAT repeats